MAEMRDQFRKRYVKRLVVSASLMYLCCLAAFAQQRTVTGTITGSNDGLPLPGVNVIVQGTTTGTVTDLEGQYYIEVPDGNVVLQFSFIGYSTELVTVGGSNMIDVVMSPSLMALEEVVITSLGITREKKRITYAAQNVETEQISQARELNVANSLAGKVAGLDLTRSSAGVGSASRVLLRGNRSIASNNQPLYIVDGVPINNESLTNVSSEAGGIQSADGISNINPEDIESITVLKGPNAAALYGSRASNGAIIISTKKGKARQGIGVEYTANFMTETPILLTRFQHEYGQGNAGVYISNSESMWGPKMAGQMVDHWSPDPNWEGPAQYAYEAHPDNLKNFFVKGYNWASTLALYSGGEKSRSYVSYTNTLARGIVENNKMRRNNFNLRNESKFGKRLSADIKLTYFNQEIENIVSSGNYYANPVKALYSQPGNISLEAARNFEYRDDAGNLLQHYWNPNSDKQNVYWILNRNSRTGIRDRVLGMVSLRYEFIRGLSLMARTSFDMTRDRTEAKIYNDTYRIDKQYLLINHDAEEINNEFLLSYNKIFGDIFSLDVSVGGNMLFQRSEHLETWAEKLLKPNLFVITNTGQIKSTQGGSEKEIQSLYGFASLGFKDFLFLDLTCRNDWSSTLPKESWSYFYPSVGLSWLVTGMLNTVPSFLTFAKVRANYAEVGNDTDPYAIRNTYLFGAGGQLGYAWRNRTLAATGLKPENTRSIELGFDVRFINNRLGLDFTWYKSNTFNQLLQVPLPQPSGFTNKFINAGNIQNKGLELTLNGTPVQIGDFSWDISFNYARNQSELIELTDDLSEYIIREESMMSTIKVKVGEPYGQIYARGFKRNDQGRMLINDIGLPFLSPGLTMSMGNYNPDWIGGFTSIFQFRGISLNVLLDMRMGGQIFSLTEAGLANDGFSDDTLEGRDGMIVDGLRVITDEDGNESYEENTIRTTAEAYWKWLGGSYWKPVGEAFRYDASFVRFRELVLGYTFTFDNNPFLQGINVALVGRNLGFLYNAAEVLDPNQSVGITNAQGSEGYVLPSTRSLGVNLKFAF